MPPPQGEGDQDDEASVWDEGVAEGCGGSRGGVDYRCCDGRTPHSISGEQHTGSIR